MSIRSFVLILESSSDYNRDPMPRKTFTVSRCFFGSYLYGEGFLIFAIMILLRGNEVKHFSRFSRSKISIKDNSRGDT